MQNGLHWYEQKICHQNSASEITDDSGKRKTYTGTIYLYFLKKYLESHDFNFDFNHVIVPEKTKDQTGEIWKKALRKHGLNI